jgi:hypothetical protein
LIGALETMDKSQETLKRPTRDLEESYDELQRLRKQVEQAEKRRRNLCGRIADEARNTQHGA